MAKPGFIRRRLKAEEKERAAKFAPLKKSSRKKFAGNSYPEPDEPKPDKTFKVPYRDKSKDPKFKVQKLVPINQVLSDLYANEQKE